MTKLLLCPLFLCFGVFISIKSNAQSHLPVQPKWKAESEKWMVHPKHPTATPFEKSGGAQSAEYPEMLRYIDSLAAHHPRLRKTTLGKTAGRNDLHLIALSEIPEDLLAGKRNPKRPLLLFQAGIHSGEIDGMDAALLFIREMLVGKLQDLQKQVDVLFIPTLNRDGLDRLSQYSRINQNGPELQGWRSNALNQNLNRDYTKLDSPELQALIPLLHTLDPELYIDIHVTDGADYQYDITFGGMVAGSHSSHVSKWMESSLRPFVNAQLSAKGHIPGPLVFLKNESSPDSGMVNYAFSARFSHAYGDVCGIPTLLVENHSLKPFRQRVCGTATLMEALCRKVLEDVQQIRDFRAKDRKPSKTDLPIEFTFGKQQNQSLEFKAVKSFKRYSAIAGDSVVSWNGQPYTLKIPLLNQDSIVRSVEIPDAFYIPATRPEIIQRLMWHGIEIQVLPNDTLLKLKTARFTQLQPAKSAFQGRFRMTAKTTWNEEWHTLPAGSVIVSTQQDKAKLACLLLHPESPESFFQWGFFADITERTEYFEAYAMAPIAEEMAKLHPEWKQAFDEKCATDMEFSKNPDARLRWWYERSAYHDAHYLRYPIGLK